MKAVGVRSNTVEYLLAGKDSAPYHHASNIHNSAIVQGNHAATFLSRCSCRDFKKQGVPCEHMYKLAGDLGLVQLPDPNFEQ